MQELDQWSRAAVIDPLLYAGAQSVDDGDSQWEEAAEGAAKAIKAKVLESYRNGLATGRQQASAPARPQYPPRRYQPRAETHVTPWPVRA